jgi:hypothetical protein
MLLLIDFNAKNMYNIEYDATSFGATRFCGATTPEAQAISAYYKPKTAA